MALQNPYATGAAVGEMDPTKAQKTGLGTGKNIMQAGLEKSSSTRPTIPGR